MPSIPAPPRRLPSLALPALLAFALALAALPACDNGGNGPAPGTEGAPCASTAECNTGLICVDGRCAMTPPVMDGGPRDSGPVERDAGPACLPVDRCGGVCCADGEECVDRACLPTCGSGLRCGPTNACCASGELCISDTCVAPGDPCEEIIDCPLDAYCDATLGRCLPRLAARCEYFPPSGVFEPVQQWHWSGSAVEPAYIQVMMTPVVGDLDGDRIPEVVFMTYGPGSYSGRGVLRVARGDTGEEVFSVTDPGLCGDSGVALGDLDGDGVPEIVTAGPCASGQIRAYNNDGTPRWASVNADGSPYSYPLDFGAPSIADLEGDGRAEVIVGGSVIEHDGVLRFHNRPAAFNCCSGTPRSVITTTYDVDGDGELELVGANVVWNADGGVLWEDPALEEGFIAVADFFGDGTPDIVVVHNGRLSIRAGATGEVLWGPITQPGGGKGGPPTVADFDGDGLPEIGVAGAASYAVYDPDGPTEVLWAQTTQDTSSNITGSSVFDFDGDGRAEVVYNDECYMRVYAGPTGEVVAQVPQNSHTLVEYPVIVDVDGDGNAEIVFAANNAVARCGAIPGFPGNLNGLRAFGDALDNWVGTRRVWNQHAYSITHIREDLRVPVRVVPNFERFNNFRQNPQSFDAPDLVGVEGALGTTACPPDQTLIATVENRGAVTVGAGLAVAFYVGDPTGAHRMVGVARTTAPMVPGASETVRISFTPLPEELNIDMPWYFVADDVGDGSGENNECIEENNQGPVGLFRCTPIG